jgi:hypothetical protein
MFTETTYQNRTRELLAEHRVERSGGATVELRVDTNVMLANWEPGDMTRYTAVAMVVPPTTQEDHPLPHILVYGHMQGVPFGIQGHAGGFLSIGYFLEKNPHLLKCGVNRYTAGKLCQLVAALMGSRTNPDEVDE